jgi:hypothetical protein
MFKLGLQQGFAAGGMGLSTQFALQKSCWQSLCRILSGTGNCSSNFHLGLKMKNAGQAPNEGWRVGRQTALLT